MMNVDLGFVEWCLGGILTMGAMVSGYLYRELKGSDKELGDDITRAERSLGDKLSEFKTHVAATYSPRTEIKDIVADLKREMRDNSQDIKDFIDAKLEKKKP